MSSGELLALLSQDSPAATPVGRRCSPCVTARRLRSPIRPVSPPSGHDHGCPCPPCIRVTPTDLSARPLESGRRASIRTGRRVSKVDDNSDGTKSRLCGGQRTEWPVRAGSPAREARRALVEEGLHPLALVLRGEQGVEVPAFEQDALAQA